MQVYGYDALVRVMSHLLFIYIAFWSVQSLNYEKWFKHTHLGQIRMFLMLLAITLGFVASTMVLECFNLLANFIFTTFN